MTVQKWNRNALFDAVWNGDSERITKEMNSLLRRTISYHDYKRGFLPCFFLQVSLQAPDIWWTLNKRNMAKGRSDVVVFTIFYQMHCSYFF